MAFRAFMMQNSALTHCTTKGSLLLKRYTYLVSITRTKREAKDDAQRGLKILIYPDV